jgi:hypothetical protein
MNWPLGLDVGVRWQRAHDPMPDCEYLFVFAGLAIEASEALTIARYRAVRGRVVRRRV